MIYRRKIGCKTVNKCYNHISQIGFILTSSEMKVFNQYGCISLYGQFYINDENLNFIDNNDYNIIKEYKRKLTIEDILR